MRSIAIQRLPIFHGVVQYTEMVSANTSLNGRASCALERIGPMDPVNGMSGEGMTHSTVDRVEDQTGASRLSEQASEPFEATILHLDQSTAEEIFRLATR